MTERSSEEIVREVLAGTLNVDDVPLAQSAPTAEALADASRVDLLCRLASRVLPRLVKKTRFSDVEELWLSCCASGGAALPVDAMVHTVERLAAHKRHDQAVEHAHMLVEALAEAGRPLEALDVAQMGLDVASSDDLVEAAVAALVAAYPESPNLELVARKARAEVSEAGSEALVRARRALMFPPGCFLLWSDGMVARVAATNGVTVKAEHPSGSTEERPVDCIPPPRRLGDDAHDVRRLFELDALKQDWAQDPVRCLQSLIAEHGGVLSTPGLQAVLVPLILSESLWEDVFVRLRAACTEGVEAVPSYDTRRRLFLAPGATPPRPARRKKPAPRTSDPGSADETRSKSSAKATRQGLETNPASAVPTVPAIPVRWVDLTAKPEIRKLITRIENEIKELTRELNVDLPQRLEEARAHGDLRENAEYDAAKERLGFVQARIDQLSNRLGSLHELSRVRVVPGRITIMSQVVVADEETGEERSLRIVPSELPDARPGDVSVGTPYAKALMGREAGDTPVVRLPRRTERLEIVDVKDPG